MSTQLPPKDFVKLSPQMRLRGFRLWFLILILLGLLALLFVGYTVVLKNREPEPVTTQQQARSWDSFLIPTVYAQPAGQSTPVREPAQDNPAASRSSELKQNIMVGIVLVLALVLLISFAAVLLAKEPGKVTVAGDILKTVLGFFIGVATTFFGS